MFAESLLEVSTAQRMRRSCTTLTSFGLQTAVIGSLLIVPLWKTVIVPAARIVSVPIAMGRPDAEPGTPHNQPHNGSPSTPHRGAVIIPFVQPGRIPTGNRAGPDDPAPEPPGVCCGPDQAGIGDPHGFPLPFSGTRSIPAPPPPPTPTVREFRPSHLLEGSLIRRVIPVYPYPAKLAHVQGPVVLAATINKAGIMEEVHVVSGHPLLVGAAVEAVSQWRYRPYILNGLPVEVETRITVNFTLAGEQ
jgi:protein TonB